MTSEHEVPRLGITICVEPPSDNKDPEPVSGGSIDWPLGRYSLNDQQSFLPGYPQAYPQPSRPQDIPRIHSPYEDPNNSPNAIWEARSSASSDSGWSNLSSPLQEQSIKEEFHDDGSDFLLDNRSYVSDVHYQEEFDIESFLNPGTSNAVQSPDTDFLSGPDSYQPSSSLPLCQDQVLHPLDTSDLFKLLAPVDAAYNRNGPIARCLQGTREQLIATIVQWIDGDMDRPICWLNGPAGSGKSAVSQTVAELCDAHHKLAASFYFLRGAGDRSRIARLIPTLAYQLSISIPATKPFIQHMLHTDPLIVRQAFRYQFQKLVIEPILAVADTDLTKTHMVILIDALDECDDKYLMAEFIEIVADAYRGNRRLPFRVFFTSRMEEHLQKIEASEARSVIYHLALQDFDATDDIRKFFRHRFAAIYEENRRLMRNVPWPWPSHTVLEALVQKASGSFIFASTLINYVVDGTDLPHKKLLITLATHAGLDPLYAQVLFVAPRSQVLKRIIGTILLLRSSLSITSLGHLLQLDTADILEALLDVRSILMIPENDDESVWLFHTSLRDFLTSKPRSGDFFIDPPARHFDILDGCLKLVAEPPETGMFFAGEASRYACINWCHHFDQWLTIGDNLLDLLHDHSLASYLTNFVSQSFNYWLNTLIEHGVLQDVLRVLRLVRSKLERLPSIPLDLLQVIENIEEHTKPAIALTFNAHAGLDPPYAQLLSGRPEFKKKDDVVRIPHEHPYNGLRYPGIEESPVVVSSSDTLSRQRANGREHRPSDEAAIPTADRLTDTATRSKYEQATNIDMRNQIEDEAFEAESVTVWPKEGTIPSPPPPLTPDDFVRLNQWEGGCLFSVHDSNLADDWVNRFYDHECLVNLRANEIGGPIPSMLSVNAPALAIFGSMSPKMIELADELATLSGFPVIIRPVTEDPSAHFKCYESSHFNGEPSGSQTKGKTDVIAKCECGNSTSMQPKKWLPGRDDHQDEQPEGEDDDGGCPPDPPIPEADPRHREITHDTDIRLKILVDGKDKGDFIKLETSVKFYPIPNVKNLLDGDKSTGRTSKPNIEAHIVRLKMPRSPSVQIDSAIGSLGFLAHDRSYLRFSDFVSLGHNEPPIKFTYLANEQQTKTANITTGLTGINLTATGTFAYAKMDSATTQAAEDTPAPRWVVKSEPTDENWNSDIMSYSALNVKIYRWPQSTLPMANIFHDTELNAKYGMSVEVSMPIQKNTPKVSLVYRHQIHCWVAVESKAMCRGIILVAANYIPDICTEHSLWIQEYPSLNLVHNHSGGNLPEGDVSPKLEQTSDGIFSFATATTSEMSTQASKHPWSSRHLKIWQRPKKPREQDIPIYTHVYRGWDHTNLRWQNVIWPKLDNKLQPSQGESAVVWKLDWQGGEGTKDVIMEETQTQGSSTGPCAESSFAVKAQAKESELSGMSVEPDKGKARAIA